MLKAWFVGCCSCWLNTVLDLTLKTETDSQKMTSLAHQLKRLALPQNDSSLFARKEVASLLFDPKDAASIDRDTFFALGK